MGLLQRVVLLKYKTGMLCSMSKTTLTCHQQQIQKVDAIVKRTSLLRNAESDEQHYVSVGCEQADAGY